MQRNQVKVREESQLAAGSEPNLLRMLPLEILYQIYSYLSVEEIVGLTSLDKNYAQLFADSYFWKKRYERHFPDDYKNIIRKKLTIMDWAALFRTTYSHEYIGLAKPIKNLFVLVKEGETDRLRAMDIKADDLDSRNINGFSLLHVAASTGKVEIVQLLLDKGAEINLSNQDDFTPLHLAVKNNCLEVVKLLLSRGAKTQTEPRLLYGQATLYCLDTPLTVAVKEGHLDMVKVLLPSLLSQGVLSYFELYRLVRVAAEKGYLDLVNLFSKYVNDFNNTIYLNSYTLLHIAVEHSHPRLVNFLLEKGFNVNALTLDRDSPLHLAAKSGHRDIIEMLLKARANIRAVNFYGKTPLDLNGGIVNKVLASLIKKEKADILVSQENEISLTPALIQNYLVKACRGISTYLNRDQRAVSIISHLFNHDCKKEFAQYYLYILNPQNTSKLFLTKLIFLVCLLESRHQKTMQREIIAALNQIEQGKDELNNWQQRLQQLILQNLSEWMAVEKISDFIAEIISSIEHKQNPTKILDELDEYCRMNPNELRMSE